MANVATLCVLLTTMGLAAATALAGSTGAAQISVQIDAGDPAQLTLPVGEALAQSADAGDTWRRTPLAGGANALQLWGNMPADAFCFLGRVRPEAPEPQHFCLATDRRSWHRLLRWIVPADRVYDVTAVPGAPQKLWAVWLMGRGEAVAYRLLRSDDGGLGWHYLPVDLGAAAPHIVDVRQGGQVRLLLGARAGKHERLVEANLHGQQLRTLSGPWQQLEAPAAITQAAVNPFNPNMWLVTAWVSAAQTSYTYLSCDDAHSFVSLRLPRLATLPLLFADPSGSLAVALQAEAPAAGPIRIAVRPAHSSAWLGLALPGAAAHLAGAGGGNVYAGAPPATLHRLRIAALPIVSWQDISP